MNNRDILKSGLEEFGVETNEDLIGKFVKYREILVEWNKKMNLTGIEDEKEVFIKHFLDSISILKSGLISHETSIIDVGTGAGLPGIPIKICMENIKLTLLDSLNKRINFLKTVGEKINLEEVEYIHSRAEDLGINKNYREKYDIATARAVASLPILLEICVPFVKKGGHFICLKGPNAQSEIEESALAMQLLGVQYLEKIDIKLPDTDLKHNILIFKKVNATPAKYPRKAGTPSKKPLIK